MFWKGESLSLEIYGASHADRIGMRLCGLPAGKPIDMVRLQAHANRRRPSDAAGSTTRKEPDTLITASGIEGGFTTGDTIDLYIRNIDTRSADYNALASVPRPSHADYPAFVKSGGQPLPGGGRFSGRMTAPLTAAGGLCKQLLEEYGIAVHAYIGEIGGISAKDGELAQSELHLLETDPFPAPANREKMIAAILAAKEEGDSLGGIVECAAFGLPVGLGDAMFQGLESRMASLLFGIPAVKGVEFGAGFRFASMRGSEANDAYCYLNETVQTRTNHGGGLAGGMTTGMPLLFRVAVKPTPSIGKPQESVDLRTGESVSLVIPGRHDASIVPRAVPAVESAAAIAIYDALLNKDRP